LLLLAATLVLLSLAPPTGAQSENELALGIYEELRPLALDGELGAELALELLQATEHLIEIQSGDVVPVEAYRTALLAAEAAEARGQSQKLLDYADHLRERGELEAVIEALEPRLPALWEASPSDAYLFNLELMLVQVLRESQRWDGAMDRLDALVPRIEAAPDPSLYWSFAHGERAWLYLAYGLVDLAALWHERAREVLTPSPNAIRHTDLLEANLRLGREEYGRLVARVEEMLDDTEIYPPGGSDRGGLLIRAGLAHNVLAREDEAHLSLGKRVLEQGLEATFKPYEVRRANLALGENALLRGDLDAAREALGRAIDDSDAPPPPDIRAIGGTLMACLARESGEIEDARDRLESTLNELESSYAAFLDSWGRLPLRPGGFGFFEYNDNVRVISELVRLTLDLQPGREGREAAVEFVLRAQALHSLVRTLPRLGKSEGADLAAVRRGLLREGHGVLLYVPALDRSHLFLITLHDVEHHELEPIFELREAMRPLVQRYVGAVPREAKERTRFLEERRASLASNTRALLPPPVQEALRELTHLTIVGTDLVPVVPFEELPCADGVRLGDRCAIGYLPSLPAGLSLLARRTERAPSPGEEDGDLASRLRPRVWMVANPAPHADLKGTWPELPLDRDAALRWIAPHSPHGIELFYGEEARPEALASNRLARADVLQVVAHGAADPEEERPAMLLLHGDTLEESLLRCEDVDALAAPELVCLTACATAKGPSREGDGGASNFEGAFLASGASAVVLSPYDIEFHTAERVMTLFHEHLARGRPPSEALQHAYHVLQGDERFAELAPLALMRVSGLAHMPVLEPLDDPSPGPARKLAAIAAVALGLGLIGVRLVGARSRA